MDVEIYACYRSDVAELLFNVLESDRAVCCDHQAADASATADAVILRHKVRRPGLRCVPDDRVRFRTEHAAALLEPSRLDPRAPRVRLACAGVDVQLDLGERRLRARAIRVLRVLIG